MNGGQRYQQQYRSGDVYGGDDIAGPPPPLPRLPPPDWTLEARRRLYPEVRLRVRDFPFRSSAYFAAGNETS